MHTLVLVLYVGSINDLIDTLYAVTDRLHWYFSANGLIDIISSYSPCVMDCGEELFLTVDSAVFLTSTLRYLISYPMLRMALSSLVSSGYQESEGHSRGEASDLTRPK